MARARDRRKSQPLADKKQRVRRAVGLAHRAVLFELTCWERDDALND